MREKRVSRYGLSSQGLEAIGHSSPSRCHPIFMGVKHPVLMSQSGKSSACNEL